MATTSTPKLALVKPTPGTNEPANIATINNNMDLIDAKLGPNVDEWTPYTPVWTKAAGTPPTLGNGTLVGRYRKVGTLCHIAINFTWGSTTNANGVNFWLFSIPIAAAPSALLQLIPAFAIDSGTQYWTGYGRIGAGESTIPRTYFGGMSAVGSASLEGTVPFTWTTGDTLTYAGSYEVAA